MSKLEKSDIGLENNIIVSNYQTYLKMIKEKVDGVMTNYILIGHYLNQLLENDLFKEGQYESINDLARSEFNLSETTIKNAMGVAIKYCDEDGNLKDEYKDFRFSALVELLPVESEKVLVDYKPEMTVKEIREKKKADKPKTEANAKNHEDYADAEDEDDEPVVENIKTVKPNIYPLFDIYTSTNIDKRLYHFLSFILYDKYSNLYMELVSQVELNLYLDSAKPSKKEPFIKIRLVDNELSIECSFPDMNETLKTRLNDFRDFIFVLDTLFDLHSINE